MADRTPGFLRRTLLAGSQKFTKRYDQTLPHRLLELFKFRIPSVHTMYVIGYSFGDPHVDQIVREWLELFGNRKMVIVDPFRTGLPQYFSHLAPQISLVKQTASDFLERLRALPLTRGQRLAKFVRKRTRRAIESRTTKWLGSSPVFPGEHS
jgi:hypothetical protein